MQVVEPDRLSQQPSHHSIDGPKAKGIKRTLRLLKLILRPLDYFEDNARQYGSIFKIGGENSPPMIYVGQPDAIREVFSLGAAKADSGRYNRTLTLMVGDHSLLLLDGKPHQRQRKLLMPPFHGDRLRSYAQLICDITRQTSNHWRLGRSFVARPPLQGLTLNLIMQVVFGTQTGPRLTQLQTNMGTMLDFFAYPINASFLFFSGLRKDWGPWSPWGRFIDLREQVRSLIHTEIRDRRRQLAQASSDTPSRNDLLSMLLQAKDENGDGMSDAELHDQLVTLLLAGHETTASAMVWMLYWICYLPEVEQKIRDELAELGPNPEPMAIAQLPYLDAVCKETLRIYPITPTTFIRVLKVPMTIAGYALEPGTALIPAPYLVHYQPELYPDPKQFRPERFLKRQFASHEYLPFGGGNRRCIGSALAMMELKLSVATLLQEFDLALPHRRAIKPVRRGLTMAPPASLRLMVKAKRSA
ncbi:MAG: cytochrome P450 [Cyanobacteria bacterium P01_F01_bin.150]